MASPAPPATGELDLNTLLASMSPVLNKETFVFCTLPTKTAPPPSLTSQMLFQEAEGTTLITTQSSATTHNIPFIFPSKMITLNVHSSLEAVGFMAAITTRLTKEGVGVNPVSGFYHDHLFVPDGKEEVAMRVLREMSEEARKDAESAKLRSFIDGLIAGQKGDWSGK